jgi:hypothetical protein
MRLRTLPLMLCALTCACASGPRDHGEWRGKDGRARLNVFISPSGEPFRAGRGGPYPLDVWFARTDANHDGAISLDEFQADAAAFFKRLDTNHDGVIDGLEISAYEQSVAPEILPRIPRLTAKDIPPLPVEGIGADADRARRQREQAEQDAEQPRRRRDGTAASAAAFSLTHEPEPVAAADSDFDGKVSRAEAIAAAGRRFALLDLDHDGRLTRLELPKSPAQRVAKKAPQRRR